MLPGGFSYGDYLRCGAIARFAPVLDSVRELAAAGGPVLGICNGFQILCEAGLLPGVLRRNRDLEFVCRDVRLRVERTDTVFTARCEPDQELTIPVKHGEGSWYADDDLYGELEEAGQLVLRYAEDCNGSVGDVAGVCNEARNVFGLMPHPEHAVDPLLGSGDGALLLAALVDAARERTLALGLTRAAASEPQRLLEPGALRKTARSFSRSRSRSVTGPRRATPSVAYAKRTSRSPLPFSSSWTSEEKRFSPDCCGSRSSSSSVAGPQGVAAFVVSGCHAAHATRRAATEEKREMCRNRNDCSTVSSTCRERSGAARSRSDSSACPCACSARSRRATCTSTSSTSPTAAGSATRSTARPRRSSSPTTRS